MGQQIQTVLQSLGCLAQHSVVAFEAHEQEVTHFITKEIFQSKDVSSKFLIELSPPRIETLVGE